jgi:hypothetical protein
LPGLSASKDDARVVIRQQIRDREQNAQGTQSSLKNRAWSRPGSEIPLEREVLRLTRKLHELGAPDARE